MARTTRDCRPYINWIIGCYAYVVHRCDKVVKLIIEYESKESVCVPIFIWSEGETFSFIFYILFSPHIQLLTRIHIL